MQVGIVHAPNAEMAFLFGKEQYGRRGLSVNIWVVKTRDVFVSEYDDSDIFDDMDSKINGIKAHIAKEKASSSRWSAHHRLYDRYFFKGNGMGGELEVERVCDETCEPPREEQPAATAVAPPDKKNFGNQPFKALGNLDLF